MVAERADAYVDERPGVCFGVSFGEEEEKAETSGTEATAEDAEDAEEEPEEAAEVVVLDDIEEGAILLLVVCLSLVVSELSTSKEEPCRKEGGTEKEIGAV